MSREPVPVPVDILLGAQTALAEALRDPRTGVAVKMGFGGSTKDAFLTAIEAAIMADRAAQAAKGDAVGAVAEEREAAES